MEIKTSNLLEKSQIALVTDKQAVLIKNIAIPACIDTGKEIDCTNCMQRCGYNRNF
jgi:hypothetical protein